MTIVHINGSATAHTWQCPRCQYRYVSPLPTLQVTHRCPSASGIRPIDLVPVS